VWLSAPEALASLPEVTWQQIGLQQQARGNHWSAFRASYREHWGEIPISLQRRVTTPLDCWRWWMLLLPLK